MNIDRLKIWVTDAVNRPWFIYLILAIITVLAAGLRFLKLGEWSFWIDEIYTINHAQVHFGTLELLLQNIPPFRNWIPVSVILTAQVLNTLGVSEWSARLVSASIGTLSIPILFFPTKRIFGSNVALIAVLLLAVSPWHIYWSQNARFYTSLMLFFTLALYAFYFGIEQDRSRYFLFFFICFYLAASERLSALIIFPVIFSYIAALWIFRLEKPKGYTIRNFIILSLPVIMGGGIELFSRLITGESRFFGDFGWFTHIKIDDPLRMLIFFGNNLGIPLIVMAFFCGSYLLVKKSRPGLLMLLGCIGPLTLLLVLNLFIFTKDRYLFITVFSWITLASFGIYELFLNSKGMRWLIIGFLFMFIAYSSNDLILYYSVNTGNRLNWRNEFAFVLERAEDNDVIVSFWPEFGPFYSDREIVAYESLHPKTIPTGGKNHWFILDSETIWTNVKLKDWLEENATLMDMQFLRRPEETYIKVYHFDLRSKPNR